MERKKVYEQVKKIRLRNLEVGCEKSKEAYKIKKKKSYRKYELRKGK